MSLVKNQIKRTTISHDVIAKSMEKISNQSMLQEKWGTTRSLIYAEVVEKRKVETMSFRVSKHSLYVPFTLNCQPSKICKYVSSIFISAMRH